MVSCTMFFFGGKELLSATSKYHTALLWNKLLQILPSVSEKYQALPSWITLYFRVWSISWVVSNAESKLFAH